MLALALGSWVTPAWADNVSITSSMAYDYVSRIFHSLQACDARWLEGNFLPSAPIRVIYGDGTRHTLSPPTYIRDFRASCVPYEFQQFYDDSSVTQVSVNGASASARWQFSWGQKESGKPKVLFRCFTRIVSQGNQLRIAEVEDRTVELVPGGEREYLRRVTATTPLDDFLDWAYRFLHPPEAELPAQ